MTRLGALIVVLAMACSSPAPPPPSSPLMSPSSTYDVSVRPEVTLDAMQPNMSGAMQRGMRNCPSAIPGAQTTLTNIPSGIEVTITVEDPAAERRVVALAELHARMAASPSGTQHSGQHGGPARIGYCPTVHRDVMVTSTPIAGGVLITLTATSPERVRELQDVTRARAARLRGEISS